MEITQYIILPEARVRIKRMQMDGWIEAIFPQRVVCVLEFKEWVIYLDQLSPIYISRYWPYVSFLSLEIVNFAFKIFRIIESYPIEF